MENQVENQNEAEQLIQKQVNFKKMLTCEIFCKIFSLCTLRCTQNNNLRCSDPILGSIELFRSCRNTKKDFNQGIWHGFEPLGVDKNKCMFSLICLEGRGIQVLHEVIKVNGIVYSLVGCENGNYSYNIIQGQAALNYDWEYLGETLENQENIQNWISKFNLKAKENPNYNVIFNNCQDFNTIFLKYLLNKEDCCCSIIRRKGGCC